MIRYIDNPIIAYYLFQHCKLRIKAKIKCGSVAYSSQWSIFLSKILFDTAETKCGLQITIHVSL